MAKFELTKEKFKVKRRWIENAGIVSLFSLALTIVLGLIPRANESTQTVGRGIPFIWYIDFQTEGVPAMIYWDSFFGDFLVIALLTSLVIFEIYAIKKIKLEARELKKKSGADKTPPK